MAPKIFITGATGYIGGDALYALEKAHPEYEFTALVRNPDSGAKVVSVYPKIRLVYGNLDDSALLEEEAAKADIVIHTADSSDHAGAAKAIAKGIAAGHTAEKPGFWIHVSGTGILTWHDQAAESYGHAPSQHPYNDLEDVSLLTSLPDSAFHRDIDKLVLGAASDKVRTAIVCPPTIYGPGRGPGSQRGRQVYNLVKVTLEQGQAPMLGDGKSEWDNVHLHDLSSLFVLLVEAALDPTKSSDPELWGERGYFLAENGHHVWGDVSRLVGKTAFDRGYIKDKDAKPMEVDEAKEKGGFEALSWGLNSKGFARRASKFLGWKPTGRTLDEEIPDIVETEATEMGVKKGHAEVVAGK